MYKYFKIRDTRFFSDSFFEIQTPETYFEGKTDLILPDCTPGILFVEKGSFYRINNHEKQLLEAGKLYLFGQKTRAIQYQFDQPGLIAYGMKLRPSGIFELLGISAHEITNTLLKLNDISTTLPGEIYFEGIIEDTSQRLSIIIHLLNNLKVGKSKGDQTLLNNLLQGIHQSKGNITVQTLSRNFNVGYKRMERLFKRHIGITPKLYTRIIRFNHCVKFATYFPENSLTDIAYQNGFFDQMHFIKETKLFTGQIPSQLFGQINTPLEKEQVHYLQNRGY